MRYEVNIVRGVARTGSKGDTRLDFERFTIEDCPGANDVSESP